MSADPASGDRPFAASVTVSYRVRFDECGPDGIARTSSLLRYIQDVAWVHSERLGFDRKWYADRGLAWVVRAVELAILAPLPLGVTLAVSTAVTGLRRVWARRRTEGRLADGTLALWSHTDWVMTDHRGLPGRIPAEFPATFAVPPGAFEPGRVSLPPAPPGVAVHRASVRPQDLDPMGHVNNAAYLDYLEEAFGAAGEAGRERIAVIPRRIRLEYLSAAAPGARLLGVAWAEPSSGEDAWGWRLADDDGHDLAHGEIIGEERGFQDRPRTFGPGPGLR